MSILKLQIPLDYEEYIDNIENREKINQLIDYLDSLEQRIKILENGSK